MTLGIKRLAVGFDEHHVFMEVGERGVGPAFQFTSNRAEVHGIFDDIMITWKRGKNGKKVICLKAYKLLMLKTQVPYMVDSRSNELQRTENFVEWKIH